MLLNKIIPDELSNFKKLTLVRIIDYIPLWRQKEEELKSRRTKKKEEYPPVTLEDMAALGHGSSREMDDKNDSGDLADVSPEFLHKPPCEAESLPPKTSGGDGVPLLIPKAKIKEIIGPRLWERVRNEAGREGKSPSLLAYATKEDDIP